MFLKVLLTNKCVTLLPAFFCNVESHPLAQLLVSHQEIGNPVISDPKLGDLFSRSAISDFNCRGTGKQCLLQKAEETFTVIHHPDSSGGAWLALQQEHR